MHASIDTNMCIESIYIIKMVLELNLYCIYMEIPSFIMLPSLVVASFQFEPL